MSTHADFEKADRRHRFAAGSLRGLFVTLDQESQTRPPMVKCSRVLPNGAGVQMWRTPSGGRVVRIARSEKPKTERGPELWETELQTFVTRFGITAWHRADDDTASGIAVLFHELAPGPRCSSCGELIDASVAGIADTCTDCALKRKRIQDGWMECDGDGCTNVIRVEPGFAVNHCQSCAIRAGREYTARLRS